MLLPIQTLLEFLLRLEYLRNPINKIIRNMIFAGGQVLYCLGEFNFDRCLVPIIRFETLSESQTSFLSALIGELVPFGILPELFTVKTEYRLDDLFLPRLVSVSRRRRESFFSITISNSSSNTNSYSSPYEIF